MMHVRNFLLTASFFFASQNVVAQEDLADPARMQLASSIVLAMGAGENFDRGLQIYRQSFIARLTPLYSAAIAVRLVDTQVMPEFESHRQECLDIKIRTIASQFSSADLHQIKRFYSSPVGQRFSSSQMNLTEYAQALQRVARAASQHVEALQEASAFIPKITSKAGK